MTSAGPPRKPRNSARQQSSDVFRETRRVENAVISKLKRDQAEVDKKALELCKIHEKNKIEALEKRYASRGVGGKFFSDVHKTLMNMDTLTGSIRAVELATEQDDKAISTQAEVTIRVNLGGTIYSDLDYGRRYEYKTFKPLESTIKGKGVLVKGIVAAARSISRSVLPESNGCEAEGLESIQRHLGASSQSSSADLPIRLGGSSGFGGASTVQQV